MQTPSLDFRVVNNYQKLLFGVFVNGCIVKIDCGRLRDLGTLGGIVLDKT